MSHQGVDNADDRPDDSPFAYFRRIETLFIRLRGAPLQFAPAEYQVAKRWHAQGIPLRLIEDKLVELFTEKREQEAQGKSAKPFRFYSLRYWRPVIEGAWKAEQALNEPATAAEPETIDVASRLTRLASALPADLPNRDRWRDRIEGLSGGVDAVETALGVIDAELLATAPIADSLQAGLETRLTRAVTRLGERLADDELARARERLRAQMVREALALPVLSLFGPEASSTS